ncbi:hypothetical protein [Candidatus Sororendozoicomonas aggregata]|uniref:hypothetical protein n=1 Tax=Candidatus Sororendozoicomonas aggregata TaxID=3073239 RepID=UPI002ED252DC
MGNLSDLMMGYRDDFYIPENIIGYTGSAALNPTVYFEHQCFFGLITQHHPWPENIGRAFLGFSDDYYLRNYSKEITDPAIVSKLVKLGGPEAIEHGWMFEFYDGRVMHVSRSPFVPIKNRNTMLRSCLSMAIHAFPKMKILDIKECISIYHDCCTDNNYFPKIKFKLGYKKLEDLKRDIDEACEGEDMDKWLVRHSSSAMVRPS